MSSLGEINLNGVEIEVSHGNICLIIDGRMCWISHEIFKEIIKDGLEAYEINSIPL